MEPGVPLGAMQVDRVTLFRTTPRTEATSYVLIGAAVHLSYEQRGEFLVLHIYIGCGRSELHAEYFADWRNPQAIFNFGESSGVRLGGIYNMTNTDDGFKFTAEIVKITLDLTTAYVQVLNARSEEVLMFSIGKEGYDCQSHHHPAKVVYAEGENRLMAVFEESSETAEFKLSKTDMTPLIFFSRK